MYLYLYIHISMCIYMMSEYNLSTTTGARGGGDAIAIVVAASHARRCCCSYRRRSFRRRPTHTICHAHLIQSTCAEQGAADGEDEEDEVMARTAPFHHAGIPSALVAAAASSDEAVAAAAVREVFRGGFVAGFAAPGPPSLFLCLFLCLCVCL